MSSPLDILATVPQGTTHGEFLLLMINDLITDIPTYKYIDDTTLYSISNNLDDTMLQKAMNTVIQLSNKMI